MNRFTADRLCCLMIFVLALSVPAATIAQQSSSAAASLTLDEALAEARNANMQLPEARFRVEQALARVREASGERYPKLSIEGDLHGGTPQTYASDDAMGRVLLQTPIYTGGELRANIDRSHAEAESSLAGYQISIKEVDRAVRITYARMLRDEATLALRERAIARLQAYFIVVRARQAAGQGIAADVLRTQQRLTSAQADLASAQLDLDQDRMTLNDLLGRAPEEPLSIAAVPDPEPSRTSTRQPWLVIPDVSQSDADVRAGQAGLQAARAGRKPHVSLEADVGAQSYGSGPAPLNNGTGTGAQVLLKFSVPLWDNGISRARMDEAQAALGEARQHKMIVERTARLAWMQAAGSIDTLYNEYQALRASASTARDASLQAESLYRGGQGTTLEVLDAYDAWLQANQALLDVIYKYHVAQADMERWGTP